MTLLVSQTFRDSYEKAEKYNSLLDHHFNDRYEVVNCETKAAQILGVDRLFIAHKSGRCFSVEYKVDFIARRTGNAFIETLQRFESGRLVRGWAYTTGAQIVCYFVAPETIYVMDALKMKTELPHYAKFFPLSDWVVNRKPDGSNYAAQGILVPLEIFEKACLTKEELNGN